MIVCILFYTGNVHHSRNSSNIGGTPKLRLKSNQESFVRPKPSLEIAQTNLSNEIDDDDKPRPTTRLSKLLSKSLSSDKSLSSSAKEDDRISDEQPTVVSPNLKNRGVEFLKDFTDEKGMTIYLGGRRIHLLCHYPPISLLIYIYKRFVPY